MHRESIVAIEAKVGDANFLESRRRFGECEADKVIALGAVPRTILSHGFSGGRF
jgi:hypothetical protein